MFSKCLIICSPDILQLLKVKFPKRQVEPSIYTTQSSWYYFSRTGRIRLLFKGDTAIRETDLEAGFPHMRIKRHLKKPMLV